MLYFSLSLYYLVSIKQIFLMTLDIFLAFKASGVPRRRWPARMAATNGNGGDVE
jgi:hypothetical protein